MPADSPIRLILGSASPARLSTLRGAGVEPEVIVSGVDESGVRADSVADLVATLAQLKAEAVAGSLSDVADGVRTVVLGCDSLLEIDGKGYGKPTSPEAAVERWQLMRGRTGVLHTGHHAILLGSASGGDTTPVHSGVRSAVGSTIVHFADLDDTEIHAYVATGEPLQVAGAFTVDGLGGPYVTRIDGDYHNVVGLSLPLLRTLLADLGIPWSSLRS